MNLPNATNREGAERLRATRHLLGLPKPELPELRITFDFTNQPWWEAPGENRIRELVLEIREREVRR